MKRLSIFLLSILMATCLLGSGSASAAGPVVGSYSRIANYSYLRLRTGPGYSYATTLNMPKGMIVQVLSGPSNQGWYKVVYRGIMGYAWGGGLVQTGLTGQSLAQGRSGKLIVISLSHQQLEAYQNGQLYMVTAATTGRPELPTPPGSYSINSMHSPFWMRSAWPRGSKFYFDPVLIDYAMLFDTVYNYGASYGLYIHDAPWRPYYGYGTNVPHYDPDGVWRTGSHGCVNIPHWEMSKLYQWTNMYIPVRVIN